MRSQLHLTAVAALAFALPTNAPAQSQTDAALLERGKILYARECAACHGVEGDGEGPGAYILSQRPRNLQLGVFKLRSTPSGELPTDDDLFETLTRGVPSITGAMMPSFRSLPQADRWALVAVVKDLAQIEPFGADPPGTPIAVPPEPEVDLALGHDVYERLQCSSCHGPDGRGFGSSALTLKDDQKRRIFAPDLTRGAYKGGDEPAEIFTRIFTGLDGSPMPAYAGKATEQELWALTHYVLSLEEPDTDGAKP